jgi:hypothetical protein
MRAILVLVALVAAPACGSSKPELLTSGGESTTNGDVEPDPDCCCLGPDNVRNATTHQECTRTRGTCEAELSACYSLDHSDDAPDKPGE